MNPHRSNGGSNPVALLNTPLGKKLVAAGVVLVTLIVVGYSSVFEVDEAQQALVFQFGQAIGEPITEPGLHFKLPFVQNVRLFDKRLLSWDGDPTQINTLERQFIFVDTTARWRIVDPLEFYTSVRDERGAISRLNDILDAQVGYHISSSPLVEVVRSQDWQVTQADLETALVTDDEVLLQRVELGREQLEASILAAAQQLVGEYGIELVDIRIKRVDYVREVQQRVFERMIVERQREAERERSEGRGRAREIMGETQRLLAEIRSEAQRQAEQIRGQADAEATRVYNESFGADPEFYAFFRTLESYSSSLGREVTLVLGADSEYFRYLRDTSAPAAYQREAHEASVPATALPAASRIPRTPTTARGLTTESESSTLSITEEVQPLTADPQE